MKLEKVNLNDYKVIRKCGITESLFDNEVLYGNFIVSRLVPVDLAPGYSIDLAVLKRACSFWVKRHPLLQATIVRELNEQNESKIGLDKHFVFMKKDVFEFENVQIVESSESWNDWMEKEVKTKFDLFNGPLWNLKLIKNGDSNVFSYTLHHGLADGKNFEIFVQFLNILGALLENRTCEEMNNVIEFPTECAEDIIERFTLNPSYESVSVEDTTDKLSRYPVNLGNKETGAYGKYAFLKIEPLRLKKLLAKIKEKSTSAKLTGVCATAFAIALKSVLLKYGETDIVNRPFQNITLISIRDKLGVKNTRMGIYSSVLKLRIGSDVNTDNFWQIAGQHSREVHSHISNNSEIESFKKPTELISLLNANFRFVDYSSNFDISNIGIVPQTDCASIRMSGAFPGVTCLPKRFSGGLFFGIATVSHTLCCGFSYDEQIYRTEIVQEIVDSFESLLNKIMD